jgi:GTP cyclohydrolase I
MKPNRANKSYPLSCSQLDETKSQLAILFSQVLETMGIDWTNDHNTKDTPNRIAKMFCEEVFSGRFMPEPDMTEFENPEDYDQLITVGPIRVQSFCSHHFMPFEGSAWIGILPGSGGKLIGLSKYARIVEYFARRPQIQEELTSQILQYIVEKTNPEGAIVLIRCKHMCMSYRGVRDIGTKMITTKIYGEMSNTGLKTEFLSLIREG